MSDDKVRNAWAVYNPDGQLVYLGLHTTHIDAWLGYFGSGALPFGAIMEKTNSGWLCVRVEVTVSNIVPLPKRAPAKRDVIEVKEGGPSG